MACHRCRRSFGADCHRWSYRLSPASVSSAARQRSSAGSQPTLGQPLFRHRWHPHPRHNVGATTYIPPVVCHQPTTAVSTGTSPPSVLPPSSHRWLTVGLPLPPLPPPCRRLPPSRHHCLVNWVELSVYAELSVRFLYERFEIVFAIGGSVNICDGWWSRGRLCAAHRSLFHLLIQRRDSIIPCQLFTAFFIQSHHVMCTS